MSINATQAMPVNSLAITYLPDRSVTHICGLPVISVTERRSITVCSLDKYLNGSNQQVAIQKGIKENKFIKLLSFGVDDQRYVAIFPDDQTEQDICNRDWTVLNPPPRQRPLGSNPSDQQLSDRASTPSSLTRSSVSTRPHYFPTTPCFPPPLYSAPMPVAPLILQPMPSIAPQPAQPDVLQIEMELGIVKKIGGMSVSKEAIPQLVRVGVLSSRIALYKEIDSLNYRLGAYNHFGQEIFTDRLPQSVISLPLRLDITDGIIKGIAYCTVEPAYVPRLQLVQSLSPQIFVHQDLIVPNMYRLCAQNPAQMWAFSNLIDQDRLQTLYLMAAIQKLLPQPLQAPVTSATNMPQPALAANIPPVIQNSSGGQVLNQERHRNIPNLSGTPKLPGAATPLVLQHFPSGQVQAASETQPPPPALENREISISSGGQILNNERYIPNVIQLNTTGEIAKILDLPVAFLVLEEAVNLNLWYKDDKLTIFLIKDTTGNMAKVVTTDKKTNQFVSTIPTAEIATLKLRAIERGLREENFVVGSSSTPPVEDDLPPRNRSIRQALCH